MPMRIISGRKRAMCVIAVLFSAAMVNIHAQSADALLDKLVEKGILTVQEANELKDESDKNFTQAHATKTGMPEWVSALKFNGDFRGRYEGFYAVNDDFDQRDRWRYRARFGITASLFHGFEVGLRLGSGDLDSYPTSGIDPISSNQSLQNNASRKGIFLDLAYAKYTPWNRAAGNAAFIIGKMENPLVFSDLLFDADYNPEGLGAQSVFNVSDVHAIKVNGAAFVIDEIGTTREDPFMWGGQLRLDSAWSKKVATTAGVGIIGLTGTDQLSNTSVPNVNVGNTRNADGTLAYEYYPVSADAAVTYFIEEIPYYPGAFPIRVGGEYVYNHGAPSSADNYGWAAGITFGKAGKRKTWELSYTYKWLGSDAWWEEVTDSDFGAYWKSGPSFAGRDSANYYAGTNVRGHIAKASYSPYDFLTVSAKAFLTELINMDLAIANPEGSTKISRFQVDAILKF